MRKRDLALIIGAMSFFTIALGSLSLFQIEAGKRSERNIAILCEKLQKLDNQPCNLVQPSQNETRLFSFIRRAESAEPKTRLANVEDCRWVRGNHARNGRRIYHVPGSRYYDLTVAEECFWDVREARTAGYRPPG